ncbi:conserved hypothetical protein [Ricinus communis]|uniref:Uncharacterized protein n=1 Tax=Ricinus communis TaxID=3988 RepID=B9RYP5_RICCO|nr:conserved hypothetical protein [Ricinus communis]
MAGYYHTKALAALLFLLLFLDLSLGHVLDVAEDMNHANLPSHEAIAEMKRMRKLIDIEALLDYEKDGHANVKHEPPKIGKPNGGNS